MTTIVHFTSEEDRLGSRLSWKVYKHSDFRKNKKTCVIIKQYRFNLACGFHTILSLSWKGGFLEYSVKSVCKSGLYNAPESQNYGFYGLYFFLALEDGPKE